MSEMKILIDDIKKSKDYENIDDILPFIGDKIYRLIDYFEDNYINMNLIKAEQQFYGFHMGKNFNWDELILSMNLTLEEWENIKIIYGLSYLSKKDIDEIEKIIKTTKEEV